MKFDLFITHQEAGRIGDYETFVGEVSGDAAEDALNCVSVSLMSHDEHTGDGERKEYKASLRIVEMKQ